MQLRESVRYGRLYAVGRQYGCLLSEQEEYFISDEAVVKRAKAAVQIELEKKRNMDIPAIVYDPETQKIYQKNSDGTRVEIGERLRKGRYSEWSKDET